MVLSNKYSNGFKSNARETWREILVSFADIFRTESLRILAERLSWKEIGLPPRLTCYHSPPIEVGVSSHSKMKRTMITCAATSFIENDEDYLAYITTLDEIITDVLPLRPESFLGTIPEKSTEVLASVSMEELHCTSRNVPFPK